VQSLEKSGGFVKEQLIFSPDMLTVAEILISMRFKRDYAQSSSNKCKKLIIYQKSTLSTSTF